MTIKEAIDSLATLKPHPYSQDTLLRELTHLDGRVARELLANHPGAPTALPHYTAQSDDGTALLAEEPYDLMYVHYLMARVDYWNGELEKCNNDTLLFTEVWNAYAAWLNRTKNHVELTRLKL